MTIGIYALYWEEQDLIYIGQSQNIEARFREHLRKMHRRVHSNYKVQNTFNLYGEPILRILQECSIEKCNELEIYYTKEFDSINKGLNLVEAGLVGWGVNSNFTKYSKWDVLRVFILLYRGQLNFDKIALKVGVKASLPKDISRGASHLWLKDAYPAQYNLMRSINRSAMNTNVCVKLRNTSTNEVVEVSNLNKFIRDNKLSGSLYKLTGKKVKKYRNFELVD